MKTRPDHEKILTLVQKARTGKVVLPQFQRNFVWGRDDITDLLHSIFEGYFIGSFLMLDTDADNVPFAIRSLQGVDLPQHELRPDWMILDGQQRLTSLHYVFAAPSIPMRWTKYPYRFFLDLNAVAQGNLEDAIWSERADLVETWLDQGKQFESLNVPFTVIERWDEWLHAYESWLWEDKAAYEAYWKHYRKPWADMIDRIKSFEVPIIEIEKSSPDDPEYLGQVCAIFEKMNSTGVRLSVYDLLTARLYKEQIDLHSLWQESINQHSLLNEYSGGEPDTFGVFLLRTIALMRGLDVKSKSLISLSPQDFERDWELAARSIEHALQRMTSTNSAGFGIFDAKWLPYSTMIAPLAAALAVIEKNKLGAHAYRLVRRWYWASVFTERYAGAVESQTYRDYQDLVAAFYDHTRTPGAIAQAIADIVENPRFSLMDVSRVNAVYRGVMCLIAIRGARDFRADDSIEFHTLDDHHIFPQAYLRRLKRSDGTAYPNGMINCILNRTLITSSTNQSISKASPAAYLDKIVPDDCAEEIMASHFIDADALRAMRENDFESFLYYREQAILDEIRRQLMG